MDIFTLDGLSIASTTLSEIKEVLKKELTQSSSPKLWVTFNLDFFRISSENSSFYNICKNADIILPDGNGILHLIKALWGKKICRITGNDLFSQVLKLSNEIQIRAAFIGSSPTVINRLEARIRKEYPGLNIVAAISPPMMFELDHDFNESLLKTIVQSRPNIVFAALGCPRQEEWLYKNKDRIGASLNIGVGAVFDFFSGEKKRSPIWMQEMSMEWLWRLLHEPRRLSQRYLLKDFPFFIKKMIEYAKK